MLACQGIGLEKEFGGDVEEAAEAFDVVLVKFAPRRACGAQKSRLPLRTSETMLGVRKTSVRSFWRGPCWSMRNWRTSRGLARGTAISCKGWPRARKTGHNCYNQVCTGMRNE